MQRPWNWPETESTPHIEGWVSRYGMPRALASALARRGFTTPDLDDFLTPRLKGLGDPRILGGIERGVARVWQAIDAGERIFVHGDYDVDGITGTAFTTRTLRALGAKVTPYVPSRRDGYGLGPVGIAAALAAEATVMITVDNGIRSIDEIAAANAAGLDVIVIDHHLPGESLPDALAIINPRLDPEAIEFQNLAAVGVAAKFVHAIAAARPGSMPQDAYKEALQLVALGTIADVVPLVGENRILVSHGLKRLAASQWTGIQALKAVAGIDGRRVTSSDVAFGLAPRINAAGRMGEASDALDLLLADDPTQAYRLAESIEKLNLDRRQVERQMNEEAADRVRTTDPMPSAIVEWDDAWPVGVVGIVANRLLDTFHRPAFMIAMEGDLGRGSARSRKGFPLPAALEACADLLEQHGGHTEAAGFTIRRENLSAFRERLDALARDSDVDGEPEPYVVDAALDLEDLDRSFVGWVDRLGPFGCGHPELLFGGRKLTLADDATVVGKHHLRLSFAAGPRTMKGIAFHLGPRAKEFSAGQTVDAVFHAERDDWQGRASVQLVVRDLKAR